MASLVADYDSDSNSDSNGNECDVPKIVHKEQQGSEKSGQNYLISQDEINSSDSSEEDIKDVKEEKPKEKLPNPLLDSDPSDTQLGGHIAEHKEGSVFTNRFETAALAKQSILEKHVKMTEAQILTGKKAKICKKFKQGRCFYGKNCQYSHDLDSNLSLRYKSEEHIDVGNNSNSGHVKPKQRHNNPFAPHLPPPPVQGFMGTRNTLNTSSQPTYSHRQQQHFRQQSHMLVNESQEEQDDDRFKTGDKRKKKVGLSQTLVPPKKAMASLSRQRQEERPWTVKK